MAKPLVLADPAPPCRPRIPRLLQQPAFRRYWSAQTVSLFGDQITMLAVPLLAVLAIGAGPAFTALFVLYVTTELDVSPGVPDLIIGAGAFGGLLGAAVTGPVSRRIGIGPAVILGLVVFPAPLVLVPLAEHHAQAARGVMSRRGGPGWQQLQTGLAGSRQDMAAAYRRWTENPARYGGSAVALTELRLIGVHADGWYAVTRQAGHVLFSQRVDLHRG